MFSGQASARVRILSSGRYLQINMAELSDRAQYTCVASNVAGKTTRQFNLAVNGTVTAFSSFPTVLSFVILPEVVLEKESMCISICHLFPQWPQQSRTGPRQCQYTSTSRRCSSVSSVESRPLAWPGGNTGQYCQETTPGEAECPTVLMLSSPSRQFCF